MIHSSQPKSDQDQPADEPPTTSGQGGETNPNPLTSPSDESPDRDTPAWEGAEGSDPVGLVDPRREIPSPPGL